MAEDNSNFLSDLYNVLVEQMQKKKLTAVEASEVDQMLALLDEQKLALLANVEGSLPKEERATFLNMLIGGLASEVSYHVWCEVLDKTYKLTGRELYTPPPIT